MKEQIKTDKIKDILEKGVEKIIDKDHLTKKLLSGKTLRVKHGVDPTGPNIHLGRAAQLLKLRAFQDLGHKVVIIIGDFTARIGDSSDKPEGRKGLTPEEIKINMSNYLKQFSKILDIKKTEIRYNSEWFSKMNLENFLKIANNFSVQQLVHRRNFKQRWTKKQPICLPEIIYPILQGYDSVMVKADIELGGYDQLFNLKMGRVLQEIYNQEPQDIITLKMLPGLDGRKMSTSWDNMISIVENPCNMYGKIMSMRDELIPLYFELCTTFSLKEIKEIEKKLKENKVNPRDMKARLAFEIVSFYYGKNKARQAENEFIRVFREKKEPERIRKFFAPKKEYPIVDLLVGLGFAKSKSEAKRLIAQGGVKIDEKLQKDWKKIVKVREGMIVQVGKLKFAKMTFDDYPD